MYLPSINDKEGFRSDRVLIFSAGSDRQPLGQSSDRKCSLLSGVEDVLTSAKMNGVPLSARADWSSMQTRTVAIRGCAMRIEVMSCRKLSLLIV